MGTSGTDNSFISYYFGEIFFNSYACFLRQYFQTCKIVRRQFHYRTNLQAHMQTFMSVF